MFQWEALDNSVTKDILDNFLLKTETPILMVYAKDDPWTGGRPAKVNALTKSSPVRKKIFRYPR